MFPNFRQVLYFSWQKYFLTKTTSVILVLVYNKKPALYQMRLLNLHAKKVDSRAIPSYETDIIIH